MRDIFSTEERIKILKAVLFSELPISVNVVAARLKVSKGLVSKYLDVLLKAGIAKKTKGKYLITDSVTLKLHGFSSFGLTAILFW